MSKQLSFTNAELIMILCDCYNAIHDGSYSGDAMDNASKVKLDLLDLIEVLKEVELEPQDEEHA